MPIWLATLPVIAGVEGSELLFNVVFFVVVGSTLIQGYTFEPLARRLGLTTGEAALPQPVVETGMIQELGGDVLAFRIGPSDAAAGHMVKELGLPRDALINLIVRDGEALLPRGSTVVEAGDELHLLVRRETRNEIARLIETWREGPIVGPPRLPIGMRGSPAIFSVRPTRPEDGDTGNPRVDRRGRGRADAADPLRRAGRDRRPRRRPLRGDRPRPDRRRRPPQPDPLVRRAGRAEDRLSPQDRAWLQEAIGMIDVCAGTRRAE